MTNKISIILSLVLLIALTSCSKIYINELSKTNALNLNNSKVLVVASDELALNEFVKTFNKRYNQRRDYINEYINLFKNRLSADNICSEIKIDKSSKWALLKSFAGSKEDFNTIDSLFNNCNSDFIVLISNFEISNSKQFNNYGGGYNASGGNMPMASSSTEYCVVKAQFQIMDKKTRKSILEFKSTGEGSVFLFAFEEALKTAIDNSIEHAILYLKTGQIKYNK